MLFPRTVSLSGALSGGALWVCSLLTSIACATCATSYGFASIFLPPWRSTFAQFSPVVKLWCSVVASRLTLQCANLWNRGVNLQHILGQIHSHACNLIHGTSPFNTSFRLTFNHQYWYLDAVPGNWKSVSIQSSGLPTAAAYFQR